jgi:hypothetical protein
MNPEELGTIARYVVKLLVERRFAELETACNGVRLSAEDMEDALADLGRPLVMPPEPAWQRMESSAIRNWPDAYSVRMDLWTANGKSDLCVELTLYSKNSKPVIEVEDIGPA